MREQKRIHKRGKQFMFKQAMMKLNNITENGYVHIPDGQHGQNKFDF